MKEEPKPFNKPRFAGRKNITLQEALDAIPASPVKQILTRYTESVRKRDSSEHRAQEKLSIDKANQPTKSSVKKEYPTFVVKSQPPER